MKLSERNNSSQLVRFIYRTFLKIRHNLVPVIFTVYLMLLLVNYAYSGLLFQFSLGLWFIALIPVILFLSRSTRLIREMSPFIILLLSYEALQGLAGILSSTTWSIVETFHIGTLNFVSIVQTTFYSDQVTDVSTFLYSLHFPLVIVSALVLWYSNKTLYRKYTYSMIICSYISLLVYVLAPSAPPWYTGAALNLLHVPGVQNPGSNNLWNMMVNLGEMFESDKLAAFPSLHAAYAALFCYFIVQAKRVYAIVAVPVTFGILFSTIYLGQHFVVDLVAGTGLAVSCALTVSKFTSRNKMGSLGMLNKVQ